MENEQKLWNGVSLHLGEIEGKTYDVGVRGLSTGRLTFTLLEVVSAVTQEYASRLSEVGSILEVARIPGSEAHELIFTPIDDN